MASQYLDPSPAAQDSNSKHWRIQRLARALMPFIRAGAVDCGDLRFVEAEVYG